MILTDRNKIVIGGYHLSSSLVISNPSESLAVSFQIEVQPTLFTIQPVRGMILKGESQLIKINLSNRRVNIKKGSIKIISSFFSQYNKQLMKLNKMYSKLLLTRTQQMVIPLQIDISDSILKQILMDNSSSINRANSSYKKIRTQNTNQFNSLLQPNYVNTMISSNFIKKMKEKQNENVRSHVNHKLREDIEFVKNQQQSAPTHKINTNNNNYDQEELIRQNKLENNSLGSLSQISIIDKTKENRHTFGKQASYFKFQSKKNMEFIILAIIAAFFVALGANTAILFKE